MLVFFFGIFVVMFLAVCYAISKGCRGIKAGLKGPLFMFTFEISNSKGEYPGLPEEIEEGRMSMPGVPVVDRPVGHINGVSRRLS